MFYCLKVTTGSPSRGGDVAVHVLDINKPSLPTPFYYFLVSVSVFMAFSTVFHSLRLILQTSLRFLTLFFWSKWSFQLCVSMKLSLSPDIILCG